MIADVVRRFYCNFTDISLLSEATMIKMLLYFENTIWPLYRYWKLQMELFHQCGKIFQWRRKLRNFGEAQVGYIFLALIFIAYLGDLRKWSLIVNLKKWWGSGLTSLIVSAAPARNHMRMNVSPSSKLITDAHIEFRIPIVILAMIKTKKFVLKRFVLF